jgi:transposase-like protein
MSNRKQKAARGRRQFTTEQKAAILRRHLVDKTPVADICDELKLQPSVLYQWLRQVHENLAAALGPPAPTSSGPSKREKEQAARIAYLEERVAKKDSVIAEISAEFVQLKKELGEP